MSKNYVPISDFQIETIKLLDSLIDSNKSQQEIWTILSDKGYHFRGVPTKTGRLSRSHFDLVRWVNGICESAFVTLVQDRRSSKTTYEAIVLY